MSCLHLPQTSPRVSLKQCSHCLPIHYLSLSFSWKWAKSLCFLCMLATDLQGNRCRRVQCTTPYVITALIKTITSAHSFHSCGVVRWQLLHLFPSGCTFVPLSPESARRAGFHSIYGNEVCTVCACVCICVYARLLQVNHRVLCRSDSMKQLTLRFFSTIPPSADPQFSPIPSPLSLPSLKLSLHLSQGARTLPIKSSAKKKKRCSLYK